MPDPRHEHGSGVAPVGDYAPGGQAVAPSSGRGKGVEAIPAEHFPEPEPETYRQEQRRLRSQPQPPKRRGRPVGSRNRKPPTEDMFDGPPDAP